MRSPSKKTHQFSLYLCNALEFYDYSIYGFLIPYIAPFFFPGQNYIASLVAGYGVFALGICARIVGAAGFGHIGDKLGRKKAIFLSITVMGCSTAAIGCLPTYEQIGLFSTLLLTFLRILQGFSLGGAYTGSLVYLSENSTQQTKSISIAKMHLAGSLGWFAGSLMSLLFSGVEINNLWRIPFLMGIVGCFVGFRCRDYLVENYEYSSINTDKTVPILLLFRYHLKSVFLISGVSTLISCTFHIFYIVPNALLPKYLHLSFSSSSFLTTMGVGFYTLMLLPVGWLCSKIITSKVMVFSSGLLVLLSYPLYSFLISGVWEKMFVAEMMVSILLASFVISAVLEIPKLFERGIRVTGVSFGYNLGLCVLGGTAPMIAILLIDYTGCLTAPCFYLLFCCFFGFVSSIMIYNSLYVNAKKRNRETTTLLTMLKLE